MVPPEGGCSAQQIHLVMTPILRLLVPNAVLHDCLDSTNSRNEIAPRLEVLAHEITLALFIIPRSMNRAFTLCRPDHPRHRIIRRNQNQDLKMIRHQMRRSTALFLTRQPVEFVSQIAGGGRPYTDLRQYCRMQTRRYLHSHSEWLKVAASVIGILLCCVLGG